MKKAAPKWGDWTPASDFRGGETYQWIAAASEYSKRGGVMAYVRYGRGPNKVTLVSGDSDHLRIACPDRELILIANGNRAHIYRPMEGTFDEFYNFSPFFEHAAGDLNYGCVMTNYTSYIGKETRSSGIRRGSYRHPDAIKVLADSGGFQLLKETVDFIDPKQLIDWYNDNVDWGMVLDLPINTPGLDIHKRAAKIQAHNTKVMMDNKREGLELFNIIHGNDDAEMNAFRKIVERPDIDRLAVGGIYYGTILHSINRLCGIIQGGQSYKHYHALGVANITQTIPFMRMSGRLAPLITSDSSSHLQAAMGRKYYQPNGLEALPDVRFFADAGGSVPGSNQFLPCHCPICRVLKYTDVMAMVNSNTITLLMGYHNLYVIQDLQRSLYDRVAHVPLADAKEGIKHLFANSKSKRKQISELMASMDFIEAVEKIGLKEARKDFGYWLLAEEGGAQAKSMFAGIAAGADKRTQKDELTGEEEEYIEPDPVKDNRLLSKYEAYQRGESVTPPKAKKGEKKAKVKKKKTGATKNGGKTMGVQRAVKPGAKKIKKKKPKPKKKEG